MKLLYISFQRVYFSYFQVRHSDWILQKLKKEKFSTYFKPVYYAFMYYLRLDDELKETVGETIAEVERMPEE
ncbi:MAG: hypothetical protein AAFZ15_12445 [Bacteroidota bacterium]